MTQICQTRFSYIGCCCIAIAASFVVAPNTVTAQLRMGSTTRTITRQSIVPATLPQSASREISDEQETDDETAVVAAQFQSNSQNRNRSLISTASRTSASQASRIRLAGCKSCGNSGAVISSGQSTVIDAPSPMMESADSDGSNFGCSDCSMDCSGGMKGCDIYSEGSCCNPCGQCREMSPLGSLLSRMSIRAEAPIFWRRGQSTPALITADSPTADSGTDVPGALNSAGVQILRGGVYDNGAHAGARVGVWIWLDPARQSALGVRYWNAGDLVGSTIFRSSDFPTQVLGRPINNTDPGVAAQDVVLFGEPNSLNGSATINTSSQLYGFNVEMERMFYADRFTRIYWIYGFNSFSLSESLRISNTAIDIDATSPTFNHTFNNTDTFRTSNQMNGLSLGFRSKRRIAAFQLDTMFRLTSANLQRKIFIQGSTSDTDAGGTTTTTSQGILARSTNARNFTDNTFVLAPEIGVNLGYAISQNLDFSVGYNYLMVPKVAQASRQVGRNLNTNLSSPLNGAADPAFSFNNGHYGVTSLGLGVQYRY